MEVLEEALVQKQASQRGLRLPSFHPTLTDQMQNRDSQYTNENKVIQNNIWEPTDEKQVQKHKPVTRDLNGHRAELN